MLAFRASISCFHYIYIQMLQILPNAVAQIQILLSWLDMNKLLC